MALAARCGIRVPETRVVRDRDGKPALLVERFDRIASSNGRAPARVHQEDICQVLDRYPEEKYNLGYEDVARAFENCSAPIVETAKLVRLIAFAYLTCNGDLHAKNVSLRTTSGGRVEMTEAYDLVSTLPYGDPSMALALDDREDNLKRKTFVAFGERFGVRAAATRSILDDLARAIEPCFDDLGQIGFAKRETRHLAATMRKRLRDLAE
jgi:serine/threonine-protein kinase HipA